MNCLHLQLGFLNCEAIWSDGLSGGNALLWNDDVDVHFRSKYAHHIDVKIRATDGLGMAWRLTGLYGHPVTASRHLTCDLLRSLAAESSLL